MADQCIVCLDNLDAQSPPPSQLHISEDAEELLQSTITSSEPAPAVAVAVADAPPQLSSKSPLVDVTAVVNHDEEDQDSKIAVIEVCGHALHDACLREWIGKANSCPICRQAFHLVHVYDKIGGKFKYIVVQWLHILQMS